MTVDRTRMFSARSRSARSRSRTASTSRRTATRSARRRARRRLRALLRRAGRGRLRAADPEPAGAPERRSAASARTTRRPSRRSGASPTSSTTQRRRSSASSTTGGAAAGQWEPLSPRKARRSAPRRASGSTTTRVTHEMSVAEIERFIEAYRGALGHLAAGRLRRNRVPHLARDPAGALPVAVLEPAHRPVRRRPRAAACASRSRPRGDPRRSGPRTSPSESGSTATRCSPAAGTQDDARDILARLVDRQLIHFADLDIAVEPNQFPLGHAELLRTRSTRTRDFVAGGRDSGRVDAGAERARTDHHDRGGGGGDRLAACATWSAPHAG